MNYGSICSGIEAPSVAWRDLPMQATFFSEIERYPSAVLKHHYPDVPLHGDFRTIKEDDYGTIDLLVGGTPCQSFSVGGLRKGLADERGSLTLEFILLAKRKKPSWILWENVPGVLSIDEGRAFGSFLGGLAECGYGFAYRILDAQYFGVPQRRRRVFVVGYLGDWKCAAAVLFESKSLQGDITPVCEGQSLRGRNKSTFGCFDTRGVNAYDRADLDNLLFFDKLGVRRPTPIEIERAFGFPDNYTNIQGFSETARIKALGNSMAVPVIKWLGQIVEKGMQKLTLSAVATVIIKELWIAINSY